MKAVFPKDWSVADLCKHLHVPPGRVRLNPAPGKATEKDLLWINDRKERLYEMIDGVLVEKVYGFKESVVTSSLVRPLYDVADELGLLAGPAPFRFQPGVVLLPSISFVSWERVPERCFPDEPIPDFVPHLVAEVLRKGNTRGEMARKLTEYFRAGVQLVWFIRADQRNATVYTGLDEKRVLTEEDTLNGGDVLPGFHLPLKKLFARMDLPDNGKPRPRRNGSNGR